MEAQQSNNSAPNRQGRQRKLRNYLLDKRFQLKYTGAVIAVTAVLSLVLGYYLYQEIVVSQNTILARDLAADTFIIEPGDVTKRQKVSQQIDREFNDALATKLSVVVKINNAPSGLTADLYQDSFSSELQRTTWALVGALTVFLLVLAVFWVYLTHKIAGPVFKLKLLFSKVTGDNLHIAGRLRKGDELQDAFISFQQMIERLREDRREKAEKLAEVIDHARAGSPLDAEDLDQLRTIQEQMISSVSKE